MEEKFGAVVVAGIAVFGLIFVFNQTGAGDGFLVGGGPTDNVTLLRDSIGNVGDSNSDFRQIEFGSFNVGKARGSIRAFYSPEYTVRDQLLGGQILSFNYNATTPKEANLTFYVLGRQNTGSIYVKANGNKVFEEPMATSASPKIKIPEKYLQPGINSFEVGTSRPGIFSSSEYVLEDIELRVNDRKFQNRVKTFRLYDYELEDFVGGELSFDITRSVKTSPLEIYVNGQRLYSKEQVRISPEKIDITPSNADLSPGTNKIRFGTSEEALYEIGNAQMTVRYLGNVDTQNVVLRFDTNSSTQSFVDREDTDESLLIDYQNLLPSPRRMTVELNDYNTTFTPKNGENRLDIPEGEIEDINRLELRSNGTYRIKNLEVVSDKKS